MKKLKRIHPALLAIMSGLLLFAAWPVSPLTFLIFFAFMPLLWMEAQGISRKKFFLWTYVTLLIWNVGTTWWVINSTVPGGIAAMMANALLMCIPWIGFYNVKKRMGAVAGYFSLLAFWLTFEFIHLSWELSWPWLTLGNVFADRIQWVQWYEYTGVSGGSLWVVSINIIAFLLLKQKITKGQFNIRLLCLFIGLAVFPFLFSAYIYNPIFKPKTPENIVVVQPNVDPYKKFNSGEETYQLQNLIALTESTIDSNTKLVVWPETAIPVAIDETKVISHPFLESVRQLLRKHPNLRLLSGIEGFKFFDKEHKSKYGRRYGETEMYYEAYNTASLFDSNSVQLYHKSKLVPGVETLPSFLNFLGEWFEQFGGTTGGYARQNERTVLIADNSRYKIAPAICYESIYGEFMSKFFRNGANIICVITNDGWWGETPGFRQHRSYAKLRAIENRTWVVRSANTGISCYIDPEGNIFDEQPWGVAVAIKRNIPGNSGKKTFYTLNGDFIFRGALALAIVLALFNIFLIIKQSFHAKKSGVPKQKG